MRPSTGLAGWNSAGPHSRLYSIRLLHHIGVINEGRQHHSPGLGPWPAQATSPSACSAQLGHPRPRARQQAAATRPWLLCPVAWLAPPAAPPWRLLSQNRCPALNAPTSSPFPLPRAKTDAINGTRRHQLFHLIASPPLLSSEPIKGTTSLPVLHRYRSPLQFLSSAPDTHSRRAQCRRYRCCWCAATSLPPSLHRRHHWHRSVSLYLACPSRWALLAAPPSSDDSGAVRLGHATIGRQCLGFVCPRPLDQDSRVMIRTREVVWNLVHCGPWTSAQSLWSTTCGQKPKISKSRPFCKRIQSFFQIKPQSTNLPNRPMDFESELEFHPTTFQNFK
jgi:hypothetical protein